MSDREAMPGIPSGGHRRRRVLARRVRSVLIGALCAPVAAIAACDVATSPISFGTVNLFGVANVPTSATVVVSCDASPPTTVVVSIGPSADGSRNPRNLRRLPGSEALAYGLYQDPALSMPFGDGLGGTLTMTDRVVKNKPWTVTIYARIAAGQNVPAGDYSDSIHVTLNF